MEAETSKTVRMILWSKHVDGLGTVPPFWLVTARYTPLPLGLQAGFRRFVFMTIAGLLAERGNAAAFLDA